MKEGERIIRRSDDIIKKAATPESEIWKIEPSYKAWGNWSYDAEIDFADVEIDFDLDNHCKCKGQDEPRKACMLHI